MYKKLLGEFLATFGLVFSGTGAIIINEVSGGAVTHLGIAMTFGLSVMVMILSFGHFSGAHMNPAVSIALCLSKRFSWNQVIPYVLVQIGGACSASFILNMLFRQNEYLGGTFPRGSDIQSFVLELFLTFLLMLVILFSTHRQHHDILIPAIAIGAVVGLEALFAGPITGASMNPARSLGPAIVSGHYRSIWIYLAAPTLGAILGSLVYNMVVFAGRSD